MTRPFIALLNKPAFLVGLTALLTALAVQPGEFASIDTIRRLQTTRSFWLSVPPVMPGDIGLVGRNGQLHYWYGMGQSLLMLPADILARCTVRLISQFREPPWWLVGEDTIVSYITSTLVCILAILVCFYFLRSLAFTSNQSVAGACSLLLGTTFLHYTQNMQENNFLLLLTLTGFYFQYDWFRNGSTCSLFWGSVAFGATLLTRLTAGLDILAGVLFISLCLWYDKDRRHVMLDRMIEYARICIPCYMAFFIIDRLYQYYRFGSLFNTYAHIYAVQFRFIPEANSSGTTEAGWLWSTPFWKGFLGPLITPEKSIFLFDPLIVLTLVLTFCLWKRFASDTKAYMIALLLLLLFYIGIYARYFSWSGDRAWGDRYVTTPVQMLAMISIPLLMRYRLTLKLWAWNLGKAIVVTSVIIQAASTFFWHSLELRQMTTLGQPTFIIGLRFVNILAFAFRMTDQWGLSNEDTRSNMRSGTPYFFPWLTMQRGSASSGKITILMAGWICLLLALFWLLFLVRSKIRDSEEST